MSGQLKIVILLKEGKASVGVQSSGCDPQIFVAQGSLEEVLGKVPDMLKQAQEKWAQSPQNPKSTIVTSTPIPSPTPSLSTPVKPKSSAQVSMF